MAAEHPFPRGFLLSRRHGVTGEDRDRVDIAEWASVDLGDSGWVFTHDPLILPSRSVSSDGRRWVLAFGLFLYAGDDDADIPAADRLMTGWDRSTAGALDGFLDVLDAYGGRHLVLRGDGDRVWLYQDATGMRTVYFSESAELVASHLNLIQELVPHRERSLAEGRAGFMTAWGRTPRVGIEALLPNHSLELGTWEIQRFYPRQPNNYTDLSVQERVELFARRWERMMGDLVKTDAQLILSLTGGWDSRTSMALSRAHLDRIHMFTYSSSRPDADLRKGMIARDEAVVAKLLEHVPNAGHTTYYIEQRHVQLPPHHQALLERNTVGNHFKWLLPHYLKSFPSPNVIHIRGNASAVGKSSWTDLGSSGTRQDMQAYWLRRTAKDAPHMSQRDRVREFEAGYRTWGYDDELYDTHRRDLFYWEIRLGRWSAEICNETDSAFETMAAMNVRSLLEMTLSFPIEQRKASFFFAELINHVFPILNFVGVNDERNLYELHRDQRLESAPAVGAAGVDSAGASAVPAAGPATDPPPALSDGLEILHDGRTVARCPIQDELAVIPAEHFKTGTLVKRSFSPVTTAGTLKFTVHSRYGHDQGGGNWRYQVWVNQDMHSSWDGGICREPIHVTVAGLQPHDVVAVVGVPGRDHDRESWQRASRIWLHDAQFAAGPPLGGIRVTTNAPGGFHRRGAHELHLDLGDLAALTREDFPVDRPVRLDVEIGADLLPMLVVRRSGQRAVSFYDGPVDVTKTHGAPAFQRAAWWPEIDRHQVHVADPGSVGHTALKTSWGQLHPQRSAVPDAVKAIRAVTAVLGVPDARHRTHFGSSSGGFWAWNAALLDPGSRAVVSNPQIDWTTWSTTATAALLEQRLSGVTVQDFRRRHPGRCNVLEAWRTAHHPARVDYWANTATPYEANVELPRLRGFQHQHPELTTNLRVHDYHDERAVHAPLDRQRAVSAILES